LRLIELQVKNFRAATDMTLELEDLTTLVGINGAGKTTILEALDLFFNGTALSPADYGDKQAPITITVRFIDVPGKNRPVSITRKWSLDNEESTMTDVSTRGLRWADRERILDRVHVVYEHAEHETDKDGTDKSDLELVRMIRGTIKDTITADGAPDLNSQLDAHFGAQENSIAQFKDQVNHRLRGEPTNPYGYAPDAEVHFSLERPSLDPKVTTKFVEPGGLLEHKSVGHGTKRAYHMAAMEAFAEMFPKAGDRLLLLLIDEPELHQHPQRQRRILQTYRHLSEQPHCQVLYSTHSQEFVDLGALHGLYRISRKNDSNIATNPAPELDEKVLRWNTARKLVEGLFSAGVILVEGWEDKAILNGIFSVVQVDGKTLMKKFIEHDINIINCHGIDNMPEFARFFVEIGIPTFTAWDADGQDSSFEKNQKILDAIGAKDTFPAQPCSECYPGEKFVCFACDACLYFKEHFGHASAANDPNTKDKIKTEIKERVDLYPVFSTAEFAQSDFAANKAMLFHNCFFPPS